ncbi:MAG: ComF family protein [Actinomycetia bacterium]|nr:ComF family protein [Actinomycetes bacterium]
MAHPLLAGLLELGYPSRCVVCERPGELLCAADFQQLITIDANLACPRCGAPYGRLACTECQTYQGPQRFAFSAARSALVFDPRSRALILSYKDGNERRLAGLLADLLYQSLPLEWRLWPEALTWIPADRPARQRRGFDHMRMLATELADRSGLAAYSLLRKRPRADQRQLGRKARQQNVSQLFEYDPDQALAAVSGMPQRLWLVDDVFTTGATLDAAASVLRAAGIPEIRALTIARVW